MKVELLNYTGAGHARPHVYAAAVLITTKATRLNMSNADSFFREIFAWEPKRRRVELEYIANSIPSSWEFIDYTFIISGVSRACAEQFKRNRQGSYAQQTMRMLDVSGFDYATGPTVEANASAVDLYDAHMENANETYQALIAGGAKIEDARGILPLNIHTNLVAKFNLRTLVEMLRKRDSARTQGEFVELAALMREAILAVHPWAELFLNSKKDEAARELHSIIRSMDNTWDDVMISVLKTRMAKLLDTIMSEA